MSRHIQLKMNDSPTLEAIEIWAAGFGMTRQDIIRIACADFLKKRQIEKALANLQSKQD